MFTHIDDFMNWMGRSFDRFSIQNEARSSEKTQSVPKNPNKPKPLARFLLKPFAFMHSIFKSKK